MINIYIRFAWKISNLVAQIEKHYLSCLKNLKVRIHRSSALE